MAREYCELSNFLSYPQDTDSLGGPSYHQF